MLGKGALIFVIGIVMIFSLFQIKLSRMAVRASDNFNYHYLNTLVHEKSQSAINYAINDVWANGTTASSYSINTPICSTDVSVTSVGTDTIMVKVVTSGQIYVDEYYAQNSSLFTIRDSIFAYFTYEVPVSEYFWYTNTDNGVYWITGDTVWGPMHVNDVIRTSGAPVFYGKVTARRGINPSPTRRSNRAKYYGGWEVGISTSLPTDMSHLVTAANSGNGSAAVNTKCVYDTDLSLDFRSDGSVIRTVGSATPDTVDLATIAPTGVIYSTKDIRVKGTLNGAVTVYSADDIWIDDDIVYDDDPMDGSSNDILGLVSGDDIFISDNTANNSDVNIHGSIMAGDKFTAQNYSSRPVAGALRVAGSVAQGRRGAVGTFNSRTSTINHGFSKRYYFDPRLRSMSAPSFPYVRELRLASWWE